MATNKINEVLEELGNKINSIEGKVNIGRQQVTAHKKDIIDRLKGVVNSLSQIQDNPTLKEIPALRGKLSESNRLLDEKTKELAKKTQELETMKNMITQQQQELKRLNDKIDEINVELNEAKADIANAKSETDKVKKEKEDAIDNLTKQLNDFKQQKEVVEKQLANAQGELGTLADRIATINANLQKQIDMISTITSELNIDEPINEQFQNITDNIAAIMLMLQSNDTNIDSSTSSNYVQGKTSYLGGKSRRKTIKRRSRKSRKIKQKGGYVYSSSKELDKASSVIRDTSKKSSGSLSKFKTSNFKKRKATRKHKSNK